MKDGFYVVKTIEQMIADGGEPCGKSVNIGNEKWNEDMENACPIHRHIKIVSNLWHGNAWYITPEMLLGPAIKPGTEVEVSTDGKLWFKLTFNGYVFWRYKVRVNADMGAYEYVRLIKEPKVEDLKTRPMNRWEMLKFAADNPGLLCRFDTYRAVPISAFVFDCAANRCQITENTGKEPRETDWRAFPEIEEE